MVALLQRLRQSHGDHDLREQLVIVPHHPDRLRRPAAPSAARDARFHQTLTWNVFRTLELLSPAFWLRRLHIRMTGEALTATPQIVRVSLWPRLPLPPIQRIDGGREDVTADAVIETEHGVWTYLAVDDARWSEHESIVAPLIDAGAWLAGARDYYCGLIQAPDSDMSLNRVLAQRYSRSRESVTLRSATRGPTRPRPRAVSAVAWSDFAAVLGDCADAPNLPSIERALASHTHSWLQQVLKP